MTGQDDTRTPEPLTTEDVVDVMTDVMKLPPSPALVYAARAVLDLIRDRYVPRAEHKMSARAYWEAKTVALESELHQLTSGVLDLAQQWEDGDRRDFLSVSTATARRTAELRALVSRGEPRPSD